MVISLQGRIQDFKLGGAHLKNLRRAEGGAKNFGVFRVNPTHDVLYSIQQYDCVVEFVSDLRQISDFLRKITQ